MKIKLFALFFVVFVWSSLAAFSVSTRGQSTVPKPVLQIGHADLTWNNSSVISANGEYFVTGGADGTIKIWQTNGLLINTIDAYQSKVTALSISEDGKYLLSGDSEGTITLWDLKKIVQIKTFQVEKEFITYLALSPKMDVLASCSFSIGSNYTRLSNIKILNINTGKVISKINQVESNIVFSPGGDRLAYSESRSVKIWSVVNNRLLATINSNLHLDNFSFSADGTKLAAYQANWNAKDFSLLFWDIESGSLLDKIPAYGFLSISSDWRTFVTENDSIVSIWEVKGRKFINSFRLENTIVNHQITGDGSLVFILNDLDEGWKSYGNNSRGFANQIAKDESFGKTARYTAGIAFSRDGKKMAWASRNLIYLWDNENHSLLNIFEGHSSNINELIFSPDGTYLFSSADREVKQWSIISGKIVRNLLDYSKTETDQFLPTASLSPDGKTVAVGELYNIYKEDEAPKLQVILRLLSTQADRALAAIKIPSPDNIKYRGFGLSYSPVNQLIAVADGYFNIRLINSVNGKLVRVFQSAGKHNDFILSLAFSSDGKKLVSGSCDKSIKIWDVSTGRLLKTLSGHKKEVSSARFTPDNKQIISGGYDKTVGIWDANTGQRISFLESHTGPVTTVAAAPGNAFFASGSTDGKVNFWSLKQKSLLSTLIVFPDKEWLNFSPEGYYSGSSGADKLLAWRINDTTYKTNSDFIARFSKPQNVNDLFKEDFSLPVTTSATNVLPVQTQSQKIENPPNVILKAEEKPLFEKIQAMKNVALIIGNNDYLLPITDLRTAVNDATEVGAILEKYYGYKVIPKINADRDTIISAIAELENLDENTNVIIYYAGHGIRRSDGGNLETAYWLPVDARPDNPSRWIIVDEITKTLRRMKARKILLISDSCYSGLLANIRGDEYSPTSPQRIKVLERELSGKSRILISSGGNEPVDDLGGSGNHSIFASALIRGLKEMEPRIFTAQELYQKYIYQQVGGNSDQLPQYSAIQNSGHYEGTMVFARIN